jgi:hypothetical protein
MRIPVDRGGEDQEASMRKSMNRAPRPLPLASVLTVALTSAVISTVAAPAFATGPGPVLLPDHARHMTGSISSVGSETFVLRSGKQLTTIHYGPRTVFFNGDVRSSQLMLHAGLGVSVQLRAQLRPLSAASVAALPQGPGL